MEITISKNKRIKTDKYNYIYCEKIKPCKVFPDGWKPKWYYPTLEICYNDLLETFTRTGDKETLKENIEEAVKLLKVLKMPRSKTQNPF